MLAIALNNVGGVMWMLGENEQATAYLEESLELRRRIGDLSRIALSLCNAAEMALVEGKTDKAATMYAEAAEIATAIGDKRTSSSRSQGSAGSLTAKSDGRRQARKLGKACSSHKNSA